MYTRPRSAVRPPPQASRAPASRDLACACGVVLVRLREMRAARSGNAFPRDTADVPRFHDRPRVTGPCPTAFGLATSAPAHGVMGAWISGVSSQPVRRAFIALMVSGRTVAVIASGGIETSFICAVHVVCGLQIESPPLIELVVAGRSRPLIRTGMAAPSWPR